MTGRKIQRIPFMRSISCAILLACAALTLGGCGKKTPVQETTVSASEAAVSSAATSSETAGSSAAASSAAAGSASETGAASQESSASVKPGEYTDDQKAAEQAIAAVQAAAPRHDEDFRKNAGAGMEARWTLLDSTDPSDMSLEEYKAYAADSIQAEIDAFGDFYLYSFSDPAVEQAAGRYMNALAAQMQGIMELNDPAELGENENYMTGYWLRILAIHDLAETGTIPVSEKYQADLDAILEQYETAKSMIKTED